MLQPEFPPAVLVFAGLDPSGGAGLQADIETLASIGVHACPVATALTVQDSRTVHRSMPVEAAWVRDQAEAVLADLPLAAVKIGLLGSAEVVAAVAAVLAEHPELPVVLDPVLASGDGTPLGDAALRAAILDLLPRVTLLTPNLPEAHALVPEATDTDACAQALMDAGASYVLVTGAHRQDDGPVVNTLYGGGRRLEAFTWGRLPHTYHGSGCTLAAAAAGHLALGLDIYAAVADAQEYTWLALRHGRRPGAGQYFPDRFFWAQDDEDEGGAP